ncbi:22.7 kDa class IV heat shock protein [Bienertia sinuspersici]
MQGFVPLTRSPSWYDLEDPFRVLEQTPFPIPKQYNNIDQSSFLLARADWKETQNAHIIKLDIPGMRKNDVKIEVDEQHGRVLKVSGERKEEDEEKEGDKWHRVERTSGRFSRQFRLPLNADLEHIKAKLENGVLKIVVPKVVVEDSKKRNKVIDIEAVDKVADVEGVKTSNTS